MMYARVTNLSFAPSAHKIAFRSIGRRALRSQSSLDPPSSQRGLAGLLCEDESRTLCERFAREGFCSSRSPDEFKMYCPIACRSCGALFPVVAYALIIQVEYFPFS